LQGYSTWGTEAEFTVALHDAEGERVLLPGGAAGGIVAVDARAVGGGGGALGGGDDDGDDGEVALRVALEDNGDGSCACKYTPPAIGDESPLRISVLVLGQHVPGSPFAVQPIPPIRLQYQSDFDTHGLLYHLGTDGGTRPYQNPQQAAGGVTTEALHPSSYKPHRLVQHVHDGEYNFTDDKPGCWMKFAIVGGGRMEVDRYCLRSEKHDGSHKLRNWQLQASNDGAEWTTLRAHANDEALPKAAFSTASWAVEGGKGAFAQFRVLQTGKNSSRNGHLACAGIELYGMFTPA
jgi:hypothetical protein